jgi:signal transduction histidine kinase
VRWRLTVLVAAITSVVVLAFVVPLAFLVRALAEDRAITAAKAASKALLTVAQTSMPQGPAAVSKAVAADVGVRAEGRLTLYLFDWHGGLTRVVGPDTHDPLAREAAGRSLTSRGSPTVVYTSAVVHTAGSPQQTLVARAEISDAILRREVGRDVALVAGFGLVVLLVAVIVADRFSRRMSRPLRDVALVAGRMRDGQLEGKAPERGPKEVVALAAALNRLAARIRQLLASERDSVADLSHRLRTPVTALKLDTEFVQDGDVADRLRGHVTQLERTVDAIVHDARRPSRAAQASTSCDVGRVVGERVAFWSALAEDQGRPLRLALPDRPLRARLDASDLSDVVDVLIDNVFAHTEDGVPVEIWVVPRADGAVVLTVEDAGPGLPSVDVINRGTSNAGSTGLGLDIVRRAALASGGSLELGRSRLGGALVRLVLGRAD